MRSCLNVVKDEQPSADLGLRNTRSFVVLLFEAVSGIIYRHKYVFVFVEFSISLRNIETTVTAIVMREIS
jgi:hypothetical protein